MLIPTIRTEVYIFINLNENEGKDIDDTTKYS